MHSLTIIIFITVILNLGCGYIREAHKKFSMPWLFWVHASVPLIIYFRISWHISPWAIPALIAIAILSQSLAANFRKSLQKQEA